MSFLSSLREQVRARVRRCQHHSEQKLYKWRYLCLLAWFSAFYNLIVVDLQLFFEGGVRVGTPALTSRKYVEKDFEVVGHFLVRSCRMHTLPALWPDQRPCGRVARLAVAIQDRSDAKVHITSSFSASYVFLRP